VTDKPTAPGSGRRVPLLASTIFLAVHAATAGAQTTAPTEAPSVLPPISVEQGAPAPYHAPTSTTGTKTDTPLEKIPAGIKVVPRDVIDDQQILRVEDALRNVSGTSFVDGGEGKTIFSRGFSAAIFRDGVSRTEFTDGDAYAGDLDSYNVERIEVLKGPASVLYGRGNPGATVNIVTKRPLAIPRYSGTFSLGSYDLFREAIDLNAPLDGAGEFAVRLNAVREDAESFRDEVDSYRTLAAPVFQWRPRAGTTLLLDGEFAEIRQTPDVGLPRVGSGIVAGLPRERFLGEPSDEFKSDKRQARARLEHAFSDSTELRTTLVYAKTRNEDYFTRGAALQADGRTLTRSIIDSAFEFTDLVLQNDVTTKLDVAGMGHTFLVGLELGRRDTLSIFNSAPAFAIDIFAPTYGATGATGAFSLFRQDTERALAGLYLQDQIALTDSLTAVLGGRFDYVTQEGSSGGRGLPTKDDFAFSPRAGLVYQPIPPLSLYGAYSRSFTPVNGFPLSFGGETLEAERAELYEAGAKLNLLGDRLSITGAIYEITRENVATADLANPGFQTSTGEQRSRGFEFDLAGEILPGWRAIAAYSFLEARITADARIPENNQPAGIPKHSGSLWTTYELRDGWAQGLGFGGGVVYVGRRQGDNANTFQLDDYTRADLAVFYAQPGYTVRLNVNNVLDSEYFLNPTRANFLLPAAPRTFLASVQVAF
jgi:iron complex outermembrane receptor protein